MEEQSVKYLNDVLETTMSRTKTTVASALMTFSCLSAHIQAASAEQSNSSSATSSLPLPQQEAFAAGDSAAVRKEKLQAAIQALEEEKNIYDGRALYMDRQADRIMTLDWVSYKRFQQEAIRYRARAEQTQRKIEELKKELAAMKSSDSQEQSS